MSFSLASYAASCGVPDPEGFAALSRQLREIIVETNRTMNLTRITEPEEFAVKHVADSIAIAHEFPFLTSEYTKIADIGCGAGFPSLVLALGLSESSPDGRSTRPAKRPPSSNGRQRNSG